MDKEPVRLGPEEWCKNLMKLTNVQNWKDMKCIMFNLHDKGEITRLVCTLNLDEGRWAVVLTECYDIHCTPKIVIE